MFGDTYYQETTFECEICKKPLHRVVPSTMVVCLDPMCTDEPLFIVPSDS